MIYIYLFLEFFKTGLFSFGGGYATLPFLYRISQVYNWYTPEELTQMTAIASITPGPVGINTATYAGLKSAGIIGSIIATTAEIIPSLILVLVFSKLLKKFKDNFYIKSLIETLKPVGCALLASVAINLLSSAEKSLTAITLLIMLILLSIKSKKDPLFYIGISAIIGALTALSA